MLRSLRSLLLDLTYNTHEDRDNIVRLIIETYDRLALAATIMSTKSVSSLYLWKMTNSIMTDAVNKNLLIEDGVAEKLGTDYKPYHLLCKSHTVEKLDHCNLTVRADIEGKVKLRQKLEAINPSLRTFFRGKKVVAVADITVILKLVTHDKSGNSVSLADEREGRVKHMSLYHERRFTKLGYSAGSILHAYPLLQMLLAETSKSNLLVEACKLYMGCELFLTELKLLAYFTHKVTLPLLNCVEKSNQNVLLVLLPKLFEDLKKGCTDTLKDFIVQYRHVPVKSIDNELENEMLNVFCTSAAEGIQLQCGREYGFAKDDQEARATKLFKLSYEDLKDLPTNNLDTERDLAKFSHLSAVAKFRNKNFKAKGIRTDMVLYQAGQGIVDVVTKKIQKALLNREIKWTQSQKELHHKKIAEKMSKRIHEQDYTTKLLQVCKTWGGPCTNADELEAVIQPNPDTAEKIIKTELGYYRHTQI